MTSRVTVAAGARAIMISGLLMVILAGCSSSSDMTCEEFAALGFDDQNSAIWEMIEEQGLEPTSSVMGVVQIGMDVNAFCGITGLPGDTSAPAQNASSKIENAVDWEEYTR